jgi:hypothetical protein
VSVVSNQSGRQRFRKYRYPSPVLPEQQFGRLGQPYQFDGAKSWPWPSVGIELCEHIVYSNILDFIIGIKDEKGGLQAFVSDLENDHLRGHFMIRVSNKKSPKNEPRGHAEE